MKLLIERYFDVYAVFYGGQGFCEERDFKKSFSTIEKAETYINQLKQIEKNYIGTYEIKTRDIVIKEWN